MTTQHANENDRLRALAAKWRNLKTDFAAYAFCADELDAILALSAREAAPDAVVELRHLYRAYVRLLESGMDRIRDLGGKCDPVDYMERNDPDLIKTRRFLATQPPADQRQEGVITTLPTAVVASPASQSPRWFFTAHWDCEFYVTETPMLPDVPAASEPAAPASGDGPITVDDVMDMVRSGAIPNDKLRAALAQPAQSDQGDGK
jgi:hypothetical protein